MRPQLVWLILVVLNLTCAATVSQAPAFLSSYELMVPSDASDVRTLGLQARQIEPLLHAVEPQHLFKPTGCRSRPVLG
jgi:hypothetical protein